MFESKFEYRSLGRTGVRVSPLALGTFNFGGSTPEKEAIWLIHKAVDAGINFIDTANSYNNGDSERIVGEALADHYLAAGEYQRNDEKHAQGNCIHPEER